MALKGTSSPWMARSRSRRRKLFKTVFCVPIKMEPHIFSHRAEMKGTNHLHESMCASQRSLHAISVFVTRPFTYSRITSEASNMATSMLRFLHHQQPGFELMKGNMSAKFIQQQPTPSRPETIREDGFTRLELAAAVIGLALLCAVALPLLGVTRADSDRAACLNNLRQMGRAAQVWACDHTGQVPWWTLTSDGGEFNGGVRPDSAWVEYYFIRDQLVTPRILVCPADTGVLAASEFSGDASRGGYASVGFRNNASSYFLNFHAVFQNGSGISSNPLGVLFGDRNVRFSNGAGTCATGVSPFLQALTSDTGVGWTNALHGTQGDVVRVDGSVMVTTSEQLRSGFAHSDLNGTVHALKGL